MFVIPDLTYGNDTFVSLHGDQFFTARRPSLLIKLRFVIDTARRPRELFLLEGAIHGAGKRRPAGHCGRRLLPRRKQTAAGGPLWPPAAALVWGLNRSAADPGRGAGRGRSI